MNWDIWPKPRDGDDTTVNRYTGDQYQTRSRNLIAGDDWFYDYLRATMTSDHYRRILDEVKR